MSERTYVLYHGNCYDGFGAAFAAWKSMGGAARYLPVTHGQPPPDMEDGSIVHILDFSYSREVLCDLANRMRGVWVLDHHKTAQEALSGLTGLDGFDDVRMTFDMDKSGAVLAWEFYHPGEPLPDLLAYVQDRDLWRFELPESEEVSAALRSYPFKFDVWDRFDVPNLKREGVGILRHSGQTVQMICAQARAGEVGGRSCVIVNATAFWSEVGARLLEDHPDAPFAASYYDDKHGRRIWSLRSRGDVDVSAIAKERGGGGHAAAAGFTEQAG